MRGIEAALHVLEQVKSGRLASEVLRKTADINKMKGADVSLASSLIYLAERKRELWENIYLDFIKDNSKKSELPELVKDTLLIGTAGILGLKHFAQGVLVNALIDNLKRKKLFQWVRLVNAVLHAVGEGGNAKLEELKSSMSLRDRAIYSGVPVWSIPVWEKSWARPELLKLFEYISQPPLTCVRAANLDEASRAELLNNLKAQDLIAPNYKDDLASQVVRLNTTILPVNIYGFDKGLVTAQSESSVLAASLVKKFYKSGLILDMCSGRGVKAGQILSDLNNFKDLKLEAWELSTPKHKSAFKELARLNIDKAKFNLKNGNAFDLEPDDTPNFIILDAPCSGSGTWTRKPDSKWRLDWDKLDKLVYTQKRLLDRALNLCAPGGFVLYITCSLFKNENESVVSEALNNHKDCVEMPVNFNALSMGDEKISPFKKGKPWGCYIWPETPWLDGFYCALIMKK